MGTPKNYSHITVQDINNDLIYHVSLNQLQQITDNYSLLTTSSGNWNSAYTTVAENSALWILSGVNGNFIPLSGSSNIQGNLIPNAPAQHNLGSLSYPWNELYLSSGSLYLGDYKLDKNLLTNLESITGTSQDYISNISGDLYNLIALVEENSSIWNITGTIITSADLSAYLQNSVFQQYSGNVNDSISNIESSLSNSGNWNSTYNTVLNTSALWDNSNDILTLSSDMSGKLEISEFKEYSGNLNNNISNIESSLSNSGNWDSTYTTLVNNSGNWEQSIININTLSSDMSGKLEISEFKEYSGNLDLIINNIETTSGNWDSTYNTVLNTSALWDNSNDILTLSSDMSGKLEILDFNEYSGNVENITNSLSSKLEISDFNIYSGNILNITNSLSAYETIINHDNSITAKLNVDDFNSYSGNIQNSINTLSAYETIIDHNNSLLLKLNVSDFNSYSGEISGVYESADSVYINYIPENYSATSTTISGHLNGINDKLDNVEEIFWNILITSANAVKNNGYFACASADAIGLTLPNDPLLGDNIYLRALDITSGISIIANGSKIEGLTGNLNINMPEYIKLTYVDDTYGWVLTN